jgi:membrane-associated protease RseP (regulator of RpoE activity)
MFTLGVVLFALGIAVSIMLHEAGHMVTAKRFGMKVTQYFVGFGPTLWSFRRGETEYGVKAIPAGGFVKIVGMTPLEDDGALQPAEEHRAFWRGKLWKRTVVLSAGSVTHFVLGIILLYTAAVFTGVPNPAFDKAAANPDAQPAVVGAVSPCLQAYSAADPNGTRACRPSDPVSPAKAAGLRTGDRLVSLAGKPIRTWGDLKNATKTAKPGPATVGYERAGQRHSVVVRLTAVRHAVGGTAAHPQLVTAPMLGVSLGGPPQFRTFGPVEAVGRTASFTGSLFTGTFAAIGSFPGKIPKLVDALTGHQRDPNGPISVVGASRAGGEVLAHGGSQGPTLFLLILASLNIFIGIFNLFPLLPLDGGHIAIAWFERVRAWWAARRGRPDPGRVDYTKLLPVTYAVMLIFGSISLLTIAADIVNPIDLFPK